MLLGKRFAYNVYICMKIGRVVMTTYPSSLTYLYVKFAYEDLTTWMHVSLIPWKTSILARTIDLC